MGKKTVYFQGIANANGFRMHLFYRFLMSTRELFTLQVPVGHKTKKQKTLSQINMSNYLPFVK